MRPREIAVLALLILSPNFERMRPWIIDKLWSSRSSEAGSNSFRQLLGNIRRRFRKYDLEDILLIARASISLNPEVITIDLFDNEESSQLLLDRGVELFEGLDIPDPEFEDWLRTERMNFESAAELPASGNRLRADETYQPNISKGGVAPIPNVLTNSNFVNSEQQQKIKKEFFGTYQIFRKTSKGPVRELLLVSDKGIDNPEVFYCDFNGRALRGSVFRAKATLFFMFLKPDMRLGMSFINLAINVPLMGRDQDMTGMAMFDSDQDGRPITSQVWVRHVGNNAVGRDFERKVREAFKSNLKIKYTFFLPQEYVPSRITNKELPVRAGDLDAIRPNS